MVPRAAASQVRYTCACGPMRLKRGPLAARMRGRTRIIVGAIIVVLGIATVSGIDASGPLLILQAVPFYIASTTVDPSARRGMFWDSAHGPPFLNDSGIAIVATIYFVVGTVLIIWGAFVKPETG